MINIEDRSEKMNQDPKGEIHHLNIGPMDADTPRVTFQTTANQPDPGIDKPVPVSHPETTPETIPEMVPETTPTQTKPPKGNGNKNVLIPLIMILLILGLGGYFVYSNKDNWFGTNTHTEMIVEDEETTRTKGKEKEEIETTKEETKEEAQETPKPQESTAPSNNEESFSGTEEITFGGGTDPTTGEIDYAGAVFYIYEGSSVGIDDIEFKYVSHSSSQVVVDVIVKGNTQTVTFPFGQQVKVNGIKNPIVAEYSEEDDGFKLNFQ